MTLRTLIGSVLISLSIAPMSAIQAAPPAPPEAKPLRPAVQKLVDDLAKEKSIESSHIGFAGAPSAVWAKWDAVRKAASTDELRALLGHASLVVRGYVAQEMAGWKTLEAAALEPILHDMTPVTNMSGCDIGDDPLGAFVLATLCYNAGDPVGAKALFKRMAADASYPDSQREMARQCGERKAP